MSMINVVADTTRIVIIQGVNPDGDSLATSLALEQILGDMGKEPVMYGPVSVAQHLRHLAGWDRVTNELPSDFDAAIVVDTSKTSLLDRVFEDRNAARLKQVPVVILDHHDVETDLEDWDVIVESDTDAVSTGEALYRIAEQAGWEMNLQARKMITTSIMYDSLGLSTEATTPTTIRMVADLVESGVSLPELDEARRALMKRPQGITTFKGALLQRVTFHAEGRLAIVHIPWEDIEAYSDKYNPSMLVLDDMRMTEGVEVAIAFKTYPSGRLTAKIRANREAPVAAELAERFGGGGHPFASGFKIEPAELEQVQADVLAAFVEIRA